EQALRASETRLRTVIESLPFDFFVLDEQGRYSMQNSVCRAHWGNAVGKRPEEIIDDPEIRALWQENNRRAYAGDVVKGQVRYHLEGTDRIYYNIISPILENDRIRGILGFNIDITEQKHVEDSLQQRVAMEDLIARISSRLIRLTAAETDLGIQETLSELGTFIGVDRSYVFLFSDDLLSFTNTHEWCAAGITPQIHHLQNLPAERFGWFCRHICNREVIHIPRVADLPDEAAAEKAEFQRQEILSMLCIPIVSRNLLIGFMGYDAVRGEKTWSEDLIALLRIVGDNIAHALARKQHDQELHEYQQRLQSLASELSLTEERQRRQLANDLHENIGQLLALMKIKLGMLKEKAAQPDERAQIQEVRDLLENTLAYARNLTLDLSPPVLYELGLKEALEWLIEQFRRQHQLKITYRVHQQKDTGEIRMEDDLRGLLYRCVRELLVNIAKHARAQRADIRMELSNGQIAIQVQDDGIGMSPNRIGQKKTLQEGFGLFNIRERLAHFGGTVTIASAPKQGTTVILRCPLQNAGP
ncbi:MAG: GAF domain-containing protein, partial [Sedimentisphaerales bacterium]|nr:GAF domain-containing protein [Sedimentisphaerales bacterium]